MSTPTHMDMLKTSTAIDRKIYGEGGEKEGERSIAADPATGNGMDEVAVDGATTSNVPAGQKKQNLVLQEGLQNAVHPFGFNDNNRLVAERVARDEKRIGIVKQTEVPKTPGEASTEDLERADAYESENGVPNSDTVEQHIQEAQRKDILADRLAQVKDKGISTTETAAAAPPPPPPPPPASVATPGSGFAPPVK
jgi:hypothetical protein